MVREKLSQYSGYALRVISYILRQRNPPLSQQNFYFVDFYFFVFGRPCGAAWWPWWWASPPRPCPAGAGSGASACPAGFCFLRGAGGRRWVAPGALHLAGRTARPDHDGENWNTEQIPNSLPSFQYHWCQHTTEVRRGSSGNYPIDQIVAHRRPAVKGGINAIGQRPTKPLTATRRSAYCWSRGIPPSGPKAHYHERRRRPRRFTMVSAQAYKTVTAADE